MAPVSTRMQSIGKLIKYYLNRPNIFGDRRIKSFKRLINEESTGPRRLFSKKCTPPDKLKGKGKNEKTECDKIIDQIFGSACKTGIEVKSITYVASVKKPQTAIQASKQHTPCRVYLERIVTCPPLVKPKLKPKPPPPLISPFTELENDLYKFSRCDVHLKKDKSLCEPPPSKEPPPCPPKPACTPLKQECPPPKPVCPPPKPDCPPKSGGSHNPDCPKNPAKKEKKPCPCKYEISEDPVVHLCTDYLKSRSRKNKNAPPKRQREETYSQQHHRQKDASALPTQPHLDTCARPELSKENTNLSPSPSTVDQSTSPRPIPKQIDLVHCAPLPQSPNADKVPELPENKYHSLQTEIDKSKCEASLKKEQLVQLKEIVNKAKTKIHSNKITPQPEVDASCNVVHAAVLVASTQDAQKPTTLKTPDPPQSPPCRPTRRKRDPCDRLKKGYPNFTDREYSTSTHPLRMCSKNLKKHLPLTLHVHRGLCREYYAYPLLNLNPCYHQRNPLLNISRANSNEPTKPDYMALSEMLLPKIDNFSATAILKNMTVDPSCMEKAKKKTSPLLNSDTILPSQSSQNNIHSIQRRSTHSLAPSTVLLKGFEPWVPIPSVGKGVTHKKPEFPCTGYPEERPKRHGPCGGNPAIDRKCSPCGHPPPKMTPPPCLGEPKRCSGVDWILGYLNGALVKIYNIGNF